MITTLYEISDPVNKYERLSLNSDFSTNTLYWIDGILNNIGASNLDGSSRRTLLEGLTDPYSMVFHSGDLYWTEGKSLSVKKIAVTSPQITRTITTDVFDGPVGIIVSWNYFLCLRIFRKRYCGKQRIWKV